MAFKFPTLKFSLPFRKGNKGGKGNKGKGADKSKSADYDPLQTVSIMDGLRANKSAMPGKLFLIGRLPIAKQFKYLGSLALLFLILTGAVVVYDGTVASHNAVRISTSTEMQMLSQRLAKGSALAVQGNPYGFQQLKESRDKFRTDLNVLMNGGFKSGVELPSSANASDEVKAILKQLFARWLPMQKNATIVLGDQESLASLGGAVEHMNSIGVPFLDLSEDVALLLSQSGAPPKVVTLANQQVMLTQRMAKNANALLFSQGDSALLFDDDLPDVAFLLGKDSTTYNDTLQMLISGGDQIPPVKEGEIKDKLLKLQKIAQDNDQNVKIIIKGLQKLVSAKKAGRFLNTESESLLTDSRAASEVYEAEGKARQLNLILSITFGVLTLIFLILLGKVFLDDARVRAMDSEQENKRNQEAILRLLNEMGDLADGDLTVQASVTEDVTGAIADSINYTIVELRSLVKEINKATDQVAKAAQEAQSISTRLLGAAQRQSREIQETSSSVLQMAQSISEVSANAAESARVAQQSLNAAEKGALAVQNSISGMNEIREQIQDTSKRIKRLGDSSMEIGEIVELISDITEQTNVLALNAAIQAASAGEAGRGFTVVAEEVQRLAERSGDATKQIGAIVKTIQTDTQDAVAAMEKSTQGVVEGAKLSDAAGQALNEIGQVSRSLAELIGTISTATQIQSESAGKVTRGMQDIMQITEETTEGTKQTAVSIGQLADLAAELRGSVAGFKVS